MIKKVKNFIFILICCSLYQEFIILKMDSEAYIFISNIKYVFLFSQIKINIKNQNDNEFILL